MILKEETTKNTAATIACGQGQQRKEKVLCFDIGRSTLDVSVQEIGNGVSDEMAYQRFRDAFEKKNLQQ